MMGQAKTTPVEALRAEAGVCSCKMVSNRLCVRAHKKAIRLPADHPKIWLSAAITSTAYKGPVDQGPVGVSRPHAFLTVFHHS